MNIKRGEIWLADLNPIQGSEQAGTRPVLIFQNNILNRVTTTVLAIPLSTNLRRAELPSCVKIKKGEGGVSNDSVILCHQLRTLDKNRLRNKFGTVSQVTLAKVESCVLFTMGIET